MKPSLSVLIPALDAAATIGEAFVSLRQQSFTDFDVVLVDDGSADATVATARAAWPDTNRLQVLSGGRIGLVAALQAGLQACRAPLVARMDADDIALPQRFERQLALLEAEPHLALVSCQVECFPPELVGEGYRLYEAWLNGLGDHAAMAREAFVESPVAHPSVIFRKQAVVDVGGYRDNGWPEDYDLWLRLLAAGHRFAKVPEVLLRWRESPGRHSRTHARYSEDAFLRCKAHHLALGPLRAAGRVVLWGAGAIGRRLGKYLRAEGIEVIAWVDIDPKKIGLTLHEAPVIDAAGLGAYRQEMLVAAVGSRGARALIREQLEVMGWREGDDYFCAA